MAEYTIQWKAGAGGTWEDGNDTLIVNLADNLRVQCRLVAEDGKTIVSNSLVFKQLTTPETTKYQINSEVPGITQNLFDRYIPNETVLTVSKDGQLGQFTNLAANDQTIQAEIDQYIANNTEVDEDSTLTNPYIYSPIVKIGEETYILKLYGLSAVSGDTMPLSLVSYSIIVDEANVPHATNIVRFFEVPTGANPTVLNLFLEDTILSDTEIHNGLLAYYRQYYLS